MRNPLQLVGEAITDLRDVAVGWRWGQRRSIPRSLDGEPVSLTTSLPADWALRLPVRAARELLQTGVVRPLLRAEVQLEVGSRAELADQPGPYVMVANHTSHLDAPVVLESLPRRVRRRTAVAATGDRLAGSGWRAVTSSVVFNTFAQSTSGGTPDELLKAGWSVLIFPEGSRSTDGVLGEFGTLAAELAQRHGVPVLPVGIRGTYAAMPRGQVWPGGRPFAHNRNRVAVRFGAVLRAEPDESVEAFTGRIAEAVRTAIAEDRTTWWQSRRLERAGSAGTRQDGEPPVGSWRRIWEQSQSPQPGGRPARPRIWRR